MLAETDVNSILGWAIPLMVTILGCAFGYGILSARVKANAERHDDCRGEVFQTIAANRVAAETAETLLRETSNKLFDRMDDIAESVNKIKGKLGIEG